MKKALSISVLSLMLALAMPTLALADIAPPRVFTPSGYIPLLIFAVAVVAVVVIIAMMRKTRKDPAASKKDEDK